jgi:hypothetical protein
VAKRRKNNGRKTYFICLAIYTVLLIAACGFGLSIVWQYAEEYENSIAQKVVDEYVENLKVNLWDDSIAETISNMPHEVQSDEECAEIVKDMLSNGITYSRSSSSEGGSVVNYDLRCNGNVFGKIGLVQDESYADKVRFGMLPWKVYSAEFDFNALYSSVTVTVPSSYKVLLNGVELGDEYITETGIKYDVLEDYYEKFADLPTKVTYEFDNIIGTLEPTILDENGDEVTIDPNSDDSQFIKDCDDSELDVLSTFTVNFLDRYFRYICGVGDSTAAYANLAAYMELGEDLDTRMIELSDGLSWSHTASVRVNSSALDGAVALGDGYYLLQVSANTTIYYEGKGEVENDHSFKIIVKDTAGDVRAISLA